MSVRDSAQVLIGLQLQRLQFGSTAGVRWDWLEQLNSNLNSAFSGGAKCAAITQNSVCKRHAVYYAKSAIRTSTDYAQQGVPAGCQHKCSHLL